MTYQPQRFTAPDGTEMVVLRAADFERIEALAEEGEDLAEALARKAGLSQVWVSRIEAGRGYGSRRTRARLAAALEAPVWALEDLAEEEEAR